MEKMKITIIGAGIGGLTTAIALRQKGFEVEIFEATSAFKKAGSGINLALNAMQVYKRLGLYETILEAGSHSTTMAITDGQLNLLSVIDLKPFEDKHSVKSVAIHRATLHKILLNQLLGVQIHLNKKVKILKQLGQGIVMEFEDGTTHKTNVLIGADGIHSVIRTSIFENTTLRKAKQVCWRGITNIELPRQYQTELNELWGKGKRFGFVAISNNEYYWYALANYKKDYRQEFKDIDLSALFSDFHPLVNQMIKSTPREDILTNEMLDLKPIPTWYRNTICLLGDSAHATTPNLGQGACQAIESALVLSDCLAKYKTAEEAFRAFQDIRIKKANNVINTSWKIGKMAHLENGFAIKLRNFVLRITPQKIAAKQTATIFELPYMS